MKPRSASLAVFSFRTAALHRDTDRIMHELSIALALIEAASEERHRLGDVHVEALHVRIGQLTAVVPDALRFSFDLAAEGTVIAGARLEIESLPVVVSCATCGNSTLDSLAILRCPDCDGPAELVSGRELELRALEVRDEPGDGAGDREEREDDGTHC